ncbi:MAG: hypothetical protein AB8B96_01960 [Lysobacterales bacterium]
MQQTLLALLALTMSTSGVAQSVFEERDGLLVIELESASPLPENWIAGPVGNPTSPNINDPSAFTGRGFIVWEGQQFLGNPGNGEIVFTVAINNPGTYRLQWRNQVGRGTNTTDHNDTWLKIDADSFFAQRNASIVCPKGFDPLVNSCVGGQPNGSGSSGWFKVYSSGASSWSFSTRTSDNDAHNIFARFDQADIYTLRLSARSSSHVIDRLVLSRDDYVGDPTDLTLPESPRIDLDAVFLDGFE